MLVPIKLQNKKGITSASWLSAETKDSYETRSKLFRIPANSQLHTNVIVSLKRAIETFDIMSENCWIRKYQWI